MITNMIIERSANNKFLVTTREIQPNNPDGKEVAPVVFIYSYDNLPEVFELANTSFATGEIDINRVASSMPAK